MSTLFFSYSHADESLRDQLEKHLSGLRRQGVISSWHDRRITAGTELAEAIDSHLDTADIILLLISPDFIASDYCYEREMNRALERHQKREARVIPVILRPCDWQGLPFGKLWLLTEFFQRVFDRGHNIQECLIDVRPHRDRSAIRRRRPNAWTSLEAVPTALGGSFQETARSSNLRIRKQFTDLDKDRFRHDGFEYIAKFFENSLKELVERNSGLDQTFRQIDANSFSAAAYRGGEKFCKGSASIAGSAMRSDGIEYVMTDGPRPGTMNEAIYVKADDQMLYFEALGMQSYGREKEKLTFQGAAELFWDIFIRPLQS